MQVLNKGTNKTKEGSVIDTLYYTCGIGIGNSVCVGVGAMRIAVLCIL